MSGKTEDGIIELNYDEFIEKYKPIKNHLEVHASCDGYLFETYGAEFDFVQSQPGNQIWTLIDADGTTEVICEGLRFVNRLGYLLTEIPFGNNDIVEVIC